MSTGKDRIFDDMEHLCSECGSDLNHAELASGSIMCRECRALIEEEIDMYRQEGDQRQDAFAEAYYRRQQDEEAVRESDRRLEAMTPQEWSEMRERSRRALDNWLSSEDRKEHEKKEALEAPKNFFRKLRIPE